MDKSKLMKRNGWLINSSALAFATILTAYDPIAMPGSLICSILLAMGMSGLRSAYGESISPFASKMLRLGVFGPIAWVIGLLIMFILGLKAQEEGSWVLFFVGPAVSLSGLALFGIAALRSKPMASFNWLPVFAGIWYPVTYVVFSVYVNSVREDVPIQYIPAILLILALMAVLQFISLGTYGIYLLNESSKQPATGV